MDKYNLIVFASLFAFAIVLFKSIPWIFGKRYFQEFDASKEYFIIPIDENFSSTTKIDWNNSFGSRFAVLQQTGIFWNKTYAVIKGNRIDLILNNHASLCNLVSEIKLNQHSEMTDYALKCMVTKYKF